MTVEEKVKEITARITHKNVDEIKADGNFKDLEADSLDVVQILVALEEEYNIELEDEEMQKVTNMGEFVAYIERKVAEKGN